MPKKPGRPKGSLNKRTQEFLDILNDNGFEPAQSAIDCYDKAIENYQECCKKPHGKNLAAKFLKMATDIALDLCSYSYAKIKSIEHVKSDPLADMTPQQRLEALKNAVALTEAEIRLNEQKAP